MYSHRIQKATTIFGKVIHTLGLAMDHNVSHSITVMIQEALDEILRVRCGKQFKRRLMTPLTP